MSPNIAVRALVDRHLRSFIVHMDESNKKDTRARDVYFDKYPELKASAEAMKDLWVEYCQYVSAQSGSTRVA